MPIDILIFAAIAAFLIFRLRSVLGTRHGDERERPNPYAEKPDDAPLPPMIDVAPVKKTDALAGMDQYISQEPATLNAIETGLTDIATADAGFAVGRFMQGARMAFEMIVASFAKGDLDTLKKLLSPKLYADFSGAIKKRQGLGHSVETTLHRIKAARIIEARLAGVMAYITVDFDAEETSVTKDAAGAPVDGNPDHLFSVRDIWTFTRDTRTNDPNWMLIETRTP